MRTPLKVGLFFRQESVDRAQRAVKEEDWARSILRRIEDEAAPFMARPDEWFRRMLPGPGDVFAQGIMGCPKCASRWEWFGRSVCDWRRPRVLVCPACGQEFPIDDRRHPFYDPGYGVVVGEDRYFLRGVWNAFVIDQLNRLMEKLAVAYVLTGETRYAERAALIMDHMATVAPTTAPGPVDFQPRGGRFQFVDAIVNRRTVRWCFTYDLLYHTPAFQGSSLTQRGCTVAENVAENLLKSYLWEHNAPSKDGEWPNLHNHTADTVRAMMAVGLVLGIPEYLRLSIGIFPWFVENTIDPNGRYYENAPGYANFAREVFADMAEMLVHYDPDRYSGEVPRPEHDPYGLNYFDHPKFQALLDRPDDALDVAGHLPRYGNSPADYDPLPPEAHALSEAEWRCVRARHTRIPPYGSEDYRFFDRRRLWSRMLAHYSTDASVRRHARSVLAKMRASQCAEPDLWDLWHNRRSEAAEPPAASAAISPAASPATSLATSPTLLGHQGIGVLRSGRGPNGRGILMRFGPTLAHGHDDLLGLNLYGLGRDLTLDIGYDEYGTPLHIGWTMRQVAHNTVVVNRDDRVPGEIPMFRAHAGELQHFQGDGPFAVMEMDATAAHRASGVARYARQVALIDVDDERFYVLDVFRVVGGTCHDYSFHASHPLDGDVDEVGLGFAGVELKRVDRVWTLAGMEERWREAGFNRPGASWGERVWPAGFIAPRPEADAVGGYRRRGIRAGNPEPGNGYGWLHDVKVGTAEGPWQAQWQLGGPESDALRLWSLGTHRRQVIAARAPTLYGEPYLRYVIVRREAEEHEQEPFLSRFVSIVEPYRASSQTILSCEEVAESAGDQDAALRVTLVDGMRDTLLSGATPASKVVARGPDGRAIEFTGRFGALRTSESMDGGLKLVDATEFRWGSLWVRLDEIPQGTITHVDLDHAVIDVAIALHKVPEEGETVYLGGPQSGYGRWSAYRLKGAETIPGGVRLTLDAINLVLGRGCITSLDRGVLRSHVPLPYAFEPHNQCDTGYLKGKWVIGETTQSRTRIAACRSAKEFVIDSPHSLCRGERFFVPDVVAGDLVRMVGWAELGCINRQWRVIRSNVPVDLRQ